MTTVTEARQSTAGRSPRRILAVMRLQYVNRMNVFVVPWIVLAFVLAINVAIWLIVFSNVGEADRADAQQGMQWSGASFYVFVYMAVIAAQAIVYTFPFALGFSTTRRDYYLGTALAFLGLGVLYAAAMTLLAWIEQLSDGWGLGGIMFTAVYFGGPDAPVYVRFFVFLSLFLFCLFLGSTISAIWMRWRVYGMLVFGAAVAIVVLGLIALFTFTGSWGLVGDWFATNGAVGMALWLLIPTLIAALSGYFILSRATPRG
ncbi:hypothetical protein GCM10010988_12280 [Cnuibacter physcomitrellae]|uniref:Uncharacterized protein n=1 Tax=Cnuibacter physcomitrellae TaxID=1619308 RepID=A0A1X9LQ36_9MICO|nr:hypothetical protein [Cnuibacter physcomitrellae]ARJ06051.1 hypothetical protein B5808_13085 [Cnuibacter physcomitrellae]GGI37104.1 hypothetical protein GCM10010988_12280 [Cnuibacter physcomitrellae]